MKRISDLWNDVKCLSKCASGTLEGGEKKHQGKNGWTVVKSGEIF